MTYDSNLHIELLKHDKFLRKNGTNLEEIDKTKYLQLLHCSVKLSDHIHWEQKSDYFNLMESFIDLKMNGNDFRSHFQKIYETNEERIKVVETDIEQLETFEPNPKSFGFSEWISEIDLGCDELYFDFQPEDLIGLPFARDEENFRNFVANIRPEIQKYVEE